MASIGLEMRVCILRIGVGDSLSERHASDSIIVVCVSIPDIYKICSYLKIGT